MKRSPHQQPVLERGGSLKIPSLGDASLVVRIGLIKEEEPLDFSPFGAMIVGLGRPEGPVLPPPPTPCMWI